MNTIRTATTITTLGLVAADDGRLRLRRREHSLGADVTELRLGYFANVTHAPALVGLEEGLFEDALGDVDVTTSVFNAGPAAIEALTAGAIDATYIGPNPSINTFIQSARRVGAHHRRRRDRRCRTRRRDRTRLRRPISRARPSRRRSWATRRMSRSASPG